MNKRLDPEQLLEPINPLIECGNDWQYDAILEASKDEYQAFICSPRGSYFVGTFKTKDEATEAIREAHQARWNG